MLVAESGAEADDATRLLEQAAALRAEVEAAEAEAAADFTKRDEDLSVELFRSLDSNNDGSIDASELQAALAERNILVSEEVVRKVIEKFDLNRDGRLQANEMPGSGFKGFVQEVRELDRLEWASKRSLDSWRESDKPKEKKGEGGWFEEVQGMLGGFLGGDDKK